MATTTVAHASLIRYDSAGNQLVINLRNTGDDVSINRSSNGNLPSGATTVQGLANSLGALAFKNSLSKADVGLGNVDNTADANKSVNYASTAGATTKVTRIKHLSTTEELDGFVDANTFQYATVDSVAPINNDGIILSASWKGDPNYAHQIYIDDSSSAMMQRGRNNGTWGDWVRVIDSSTIRSQSVNYANTAGSTTKVTRIKHLSTTEELDGFVDANTFQYATVDSVAPINNDGIILSASWKGDPNYAHQIYIDDSSSAMMQRGRNNGTWGDWVRVIDSSTIRSQSVNYANSASSATTATHVVDCGNVSNTIEIGYSGSSISGDAIRYIAGYTYGGNGNVARIKDVSKSALISWMGVLPGDSIFYVSKEAPSGPCIWAKID